MSTASVLAPFATLAVLGVAGLGVAALIAPRSSRDAQAALAPLLAATLVFVTSPIVLITSHPSLVAALVVGLLTLFTVARFRDSIAIAARASVPALLACLAILICAAPALKHGTWAAATTGNEDAYIWVSQARSLEHGPPSGPAATTPDRVPFDLISRQSWPIAIPVGLAELANVARVDPVYAYGMFAVVIVGMLVLAVFFAARGCLQWSQHRSAFAAITISLNGLVLLSSFYGWQAQLLLTASGTLFILMLPACFEEHAGICECLGPALFGACGVALYGWAFAPFGLVAVTVCWDMRRRMSRMTTPQSFGLRLGTVAALAVALGAVAITRALITIARGATHASTAKLSFWRQYAWGFPSDALGLVPRNPREVIPGTSWKVLAFAVAAILVLRGLRSSYLSSHNLRSTIVPTASLTILGELLALALAGSTPYASLKLMAYSAPFWTLLVLTPRSGRLLRGCMPTRVEHLSLAFVKIFTACLLITATCFFVTTSGFAMSMGLRQTRPATEVLGVARAAGALPSSEVTLVAVDDAWDQVWLAYFLRDRPIALLRPSIAFTGYSARAAARAERFDVAASFEIRERSPRRPYVWRDGRFGVYALRHPSTSPPVGSTTG